MLGVLSKLIAIVEKLIFLPVGVLVKDVRGIGNFLMAGLWRAIGLPDPENGLQAFLKALWAKIGVPNLTDPAELIQVLDNLLALLGSVSPLTPIKLNDPLIADARKLISDPRGRTAILGLSSYLAHGGRAAGGASR